MSSDEKQPVYKVIRATTDKLQEALNDFRYGDLGSQGEAHEVYQVTHVGGRDWVIITRRVASMHIKTAAITEDIESFVTEAGKRFSPLGRAR